MKYLLMIYSSPVTWDAMPDPERQELMNEAEKIMQELADTGEWVGGAGLADPSQSRTVRVRNQTPAVTDGPYLETKEHLAGFCVIDCESLDRATDVATRWPDARYTGVELRPIMDTAGSLEI